MGELINLISTSMGKIIEHTTGRSIYQGTLMSIAGSVRLTNPKSGKSKYFIVCHVCSLLDNHVKLD